jgi:hypothetical protein
MSEDFISSPINPTEEVVKPPQEEEEAPSAAPAVPEGSLVLAPNTAKNLKSLCGEARRIKKLMGARAMENKPSNDLEDVLETICEKILWLLEQEAGL